MDKFIDLLAPLFQVGQIPTLQEMSNLFMEIRPILLSGLLSRLTEEITREYGEATHADCPRYNRVQRIRFESKVISTMNGVFELDRPYFYCKNCELGFHPMGPASTSGMMR